jgi:hypothetical protein
MLLTKDTPESHKYVVCDCADHIIPYVTSFDTETKEIELCIQVAMSNNDETKEGDKEKGFRILMQEIQDEHGVMSATPILVRFKLPGAYVKKDGEILQ